MYKQYRNFVANSYVGLSGREAIEWNNFFLGEVMQNFTSLI